MDDVLGSVDNAEVAVERMRQVKEVLEAGGFALQQWERIPITKGFWSWSGSLNRIHFTENET